MKAILKYPLYKRTQPTNEILARGYLEVDSVIEVKQVFSGKPIDGVSIWFFADDGFYYWAGGADFNEDKIFDNWNTLPLNTKKDLLNSLVSDEIYWFQNKVTGYLGCGWGYKNDDLVRGLAVSVFVDQKTSLNIIGSTIRYKGFDIPVDVKEAGDFEHLAFRPGVTDIAPDITNPIDMGGSISVAGSKKYGTRSMVLINEHGITCLMTCFHVLFDTAKETGDVTIKAPRQLFAESPCRFRNPFASLVKVRTDLTVLNGKYNAFYDFAVTVVPDNLLFNNGFGNIKFHDFYLMSDLKNLQNEILTIAGATSNKQSGKVLDIGKNITVDKKQSFHDLIVTEKISMPGDSGAPVVDKNNKLVGIVIAGNKKDGKTLILPVSYLFTQLGYKFL